MMILLYKIIYVVRLMTKGKGPGEGQILKKLMTSFMNGPFRHLFTDFVANKVLCFI